LVQWRANGKYVQGLDQSVEGVGNIHRASAYQMAEWGIKTGPSPIRWQNGEYRQGLDLSDGRIGNKDRAFTYQMAEWGI
jgi:hypothetical protein